MNQIEQQLIQNLNQNTGQPQKPKNTFQEDEDVVSIELDLQDSGLNLDVNTEKILQEDNPTGIWLIAAGQEYDQRAFGVEWEDAQLKKVADRTFELNLISGDAKFSILLHPALIGGDLDAAKAEYAAALQAYERDLAVWENKKRSRIQNVRDSINQLKVEVQTEMEAAGFQQKTPQKAAINSVFEVSQFGIWNCDRILGPKDKKMILDVKDQNGKLYKQHTAYVVDKSQNTLYRFYVGEQALLPMANNQELELWLVTRDDKIAILKGQAWKEKVNNEEIPLLQLELQDILYNNPEEVRAVLE